MRFFVRGAGKGILNIIDSNSLDVYVTLACRPSFREWLFQYVDEDSLGIRCREVTILGVCIGIATPGEQP